MRDVKKPVSSNYATLLAKVKERVRLGQYEALRCVNHELITLYCDIGAKIQKNVEGFL